MADYFEFRPTEDNIGDLREHNRDESLIDAFAKWIDRGDELDSLIRQIELLAFADLPIWVMALACSKPRGWTITLLPNRN